MRLYIEYVCNVYTVQTNNIVHECHEWRTDNNGGLRIWPSGKTVVMDYEGYTFVFLSKKNKQDFFIKMWYMLCFYFSTVEKSF